MGKAEKSRNLFGDFPPISTQEWEQVIQKDLKGADYAKKLIWKSPEGIDVKPYYRTDDLKGLGHLGYLPGEFPYVRGNAPQGNPWYIRQDVVVEDCSKAAQDALLLISKGVESVNFQTNDDPSVEDVKGLILALPIDQVEVSFEGFDPGTILDALDELVESGDLDPVKVKGSLQFDPIGEFNLTGRFDDEEELYELAASWIIRAASYPNLRILGINGRFFHNAGATAVQELAFSLTQAYEYVVEMTEREIPVELVAEKISFHLSAGSNYFFEIAKFRAARMLWSRILEACGLENHPSAQMYIHAETSFWNKTVYDPFVNVLRTTTEAMASVLGGVNSLTVLPFDLTYEKPTPFAERIARNQQILLKGEVHLDQVADPAAGSYYIETLTDSIAAEAWKLLQQTEAKGGYVEAFYDGWVQDAIVTAASKRDEAIAQRREVLLGTNQYPNGDEKMLGKADPMIMNSWVADTEDAEAQPLNLYRGAEAFEQIRMRTEESGLRPVVFLLTIGNLAMRKARAGFASNFFACAGYQILDNPGFDTVAEGVEAAGKAGADVIVLCSSDEEYAVFGPELASQVNGTTIPVIAGYPKEIIEELKSAGITEFIHVKSNALQTLQHFNELIIKK
ncbi:MAG: methylmalonyl-CoA mutase small subunit [Bacteroidales bacterium]|nr:methylmalonyl-CoA mutase small subunit [Bacteroidales bacterium]